MVALSRFFLSRSEVVAKATRAAAAPSCHVPGGAARRQRGVVGLLVAALYDQSGEARSSTLLTSR